MSRLSKFLSNFISIVNQWRPVFTTTRSWKCVLTYACATISRFGKKITLTNVFLSTGNTEQKPSAIYKFFSKLKWSGCNLFTSIIDNSLEYFEDDFIAIDADDSKFKKTGKKIPKTSWQRDPMSPPFHVNFIWGLRFLQFSVLLPLYKHHKTGCRAIPIAFTDAPPVKKPSKKASEAEKKAVCRSKNDTQCKTDPSISR